MTEIWDYLSQISNIRTILTRVSCFVPFFFSVDLTIKEPEKFIPISNPSAFLPIAHPTERNALSVCLASLAFLSVSVVVTSIFTILILPLWFISCFIRRIGIWVANIFQGSVCCQCGQLRHVNRSKGVFDQFLSYLASSSTPENECHCVPAFGSEQTCQQALRPLTAAELRWLPVLEINQNSIQLSKSQDRFYSAVDPPIVIVCLRFGAPGIRLSRLRDLIASRLLVRSTPHSSTASSPRGSCFTDKGSSDVQRRRRASSVIPPPDTRSRLTQCLTYVSTGYAWTECMAFRLEDHVVRIPAAISSKYEGKLDTTFSTSDDKYDQHSSLPTVENLINDLNASPLRMDRPLWKAHLIEQYYDVSIAVYL